MSRRAMRSLIDDALDDLDRTVDQAATDLGEISLAGRALDQATSAGASNEALSTRKRQLAQFRASRAAQGHAPLPQTPDTKGSR